MRARIRRRRNNRGLKLLLGIILAVFAIVLIVVGVKFALNGFSSGDGEKKNNKKEEIVKVTEITLSCDNPVVRAGETMKLDLEVAPANATDSSVEWTVSGEGMGTVDGNGMFTPSLEAGKSDVEITATAKDGSGVTATIKIRVLEAIDPSKPMVAVTYDDGPSSKTTPQVLDVLEENYAVATFFMVGKNIEGNEDILKRSYALGNEMASHTWDHPQLSRLSDDSAKKQLDDTDAAIRNAVEVENIILRPPYGDFDADTKAICGKPIIMWSVDTLDWKTRNTDKTVDACLNAQDGDIILMHDIHQPTVDGTERIIKGLQEKGFQLVTVSELYEYRKGEYGAGTVHYSMTLDEYNKILEEEAAAAAATAEESSTGTEETTTAGETVTE